MGRNLFWGSFNFEDHKCYNWWRQIRFNGKKWFGLSSEGINRFNFEERGGFVQSSELQPLTRETIIIIIFFFVGCGEGERERECALRIEGH